MATAIIGDITVGYDDEGAGDALVLVHGHPFDRTMWRPQVERFSRAGWRVVAPDLRGYGESTVVPGKTTLDAFARDIAALLDRLGMDRFVLCGLSMGGQITLEFHRLFAHRLRGLVLADTSAPADSEAPASGAGAWPSGWCARAWGRTRRRCCTRWSRRARRPRWPRTCWT